MKNTYWRSPSLTFLTSPSERIKYLVTLRSLSNYLNLWITSKTFAPKEHRPEYLSALFRNFEHFGHLDVAQQEFAYFDVEYIGPWNLRSRLHRLRYVRRRYHLLRSFDGLLKRRKKIDESDIAITFGNLKRILLRNLARRAFNQFE